MSCHFWSLLLSLVLLLAVFLLPNAARAQEHAPVLRVTAENISRGADSASGLLRMDDGVRAGDIIRYRLTFTNTTGEPIRHVVIRNAIPRPLRLVEGSLTISRANAQIAVIADSSRTLVAARSALSNPASKRPTDIQWLVPDWIAPGETVSASFDAQFAP